MASTIPMPGTGAASGMMAASAAPSPTSPINFLIAAADQSGGGDPHRSAHPSRPRSPRLYQILRQAPCTPNQGREMIEAKLKCQCTDGEVTLALRDRAPSEDIADYMEYIQYKLGEWHKPRGCGCTALENYVKLPISDDKPIGVR